MTDPQTVRAHLGRIVITVYGKPQPQGSKSFKGMSRKLSARGNRVPILVESAKGLPAWRRAVTKAVRAFWEGREPIAGAVTLRVAFTLPRPKRLPVQRKVPHITKPDGSKLLRAVEDAITDAGLWRDDAQVVVGVFEKLYEGDAGALRRPGAVIHITPWEDACADSAR